MSFGRYEKDRRLNIENSVLLYNETDGSLEFVCSTTIPGSGVTSPDYFQRRLHGGDMNRESGSNAMDIKVVVVQKNSFLTPYSFKFHGTTM